MHTPTHTLAELGFSADFLRQLDIDEIGRVTPARVTAVHRTELRAQTEAGPRSLILPPGQSTGDIAVGDWVLAEPETGRVLRVLDRRSLLQRRAAGEDARVQLIAANVDTLFITTSCNADFNIARLERYLALAHGAGVLPVIVLTRADLSPDPAHYLDRLRKAAPAVMAVALNAQDADAVKNALSGWCGPGQTVAFVGSSGVGKSTLAAALTGQDLATAGIREDDAKGRHTTTARTLWPLAGGGWMIDTPGMRSLPLSDVADGIDTVFSDIADLATTCRFSDCAHESEPGCAVQAAIADGRLDADRVARWQKLRLEDARNAETLAEARKRGKDLGRFHRRTLKESKKLRGKD